MILGILLSTFSAPISVSAHSATYLQTLIDTRGFQYTSNLVTDTPGFVKENNHLESQTATYFQLFQIKNQNLIQKTVYWWWKSISNPLLLQWR